MQPRRRVDDVTGDHPLALERPGVKSDERLSGVHTDADRERRLRSLDLHRGDLVEYLQRRSYRPLGVITVRDRRPEDAHDGVSDELLDRSAEGLDHPPQRRVIRREDGPNVLGVKSLGARRESDQIGEQHRNDPPFLAVRPRVHRLVQRHPAAPAEPEIGRNLRSTLGAGDLKRAATRGAEPLAEVVLVAAAWTRASFRHAVAALSLYDHCRVSDAKSRRYAPLVVHYEFEDLALGVFGYGRGIGPVGAVPPLTAVTSSSVMSRSSVAACSSGSRPICVLSHGIGVKIGRLPDARVIGTPLF